jgi:hypothetical protein
MVASLNKAVLPTFAALWPGFYADILSPAFRQSSITKGAVKQIQEIAKNEPCVNKRHPQQNRLGRSVQHKQLLPVSMNKIKRA